MAVRHNVIVRRIAEMRRLSDAERRQAIVSSPNVIGFNRFAPFTARVRHNEIVAAVNISQSEVIV